MWDLDYKESWVLKNWCFWTVVLEKTLESPLDCKEIQPVNCNRNQSWIFIRRTDAEAETPILLATWNEELTHWKRLWCWERLKAGGEGDNRGWDNEMVGWHHWLDGPKFEKAPRVGDWQGSLVCYSPWGCKESDATEGLNWTDTSVCSWDNCNLPQGRNCYYPHFPVEEFDSKKVRLEPTLVLESRTPNCHILLVLKEGTFCL